MKKSYFKLAAIISFSLFLTPHKSLAQEALTWEDCLAEAKKNNPDLISAAEAINQEKANKVITASGLFPQINTNLDASTAGTSTTSSSGVTTKATADSYSYGVTGSQLVFDGLKTLNDVKGASEDIKASRENYRFASSEVRLNLRTAFINLLKAQELMKVLEEIVKIRRDNLELITLRYESGLEHKGALLTAEANLKSAEFELAQAKRSVTFVQRQLTKEMGRTEFKLVSVQGDFSITENPKNKPNLEEMANKHPSILQATFRKNSASYGLKSTYGNFFPALTGTAGVSKRSSVWPPRDSQWDLGVGLTMPIFEGGLRFAQVAQAKAIYNQAREDERSTKDSILVSLEQYWAALQDAIETVEVVRKSLSAAVERSNIAEAQYSTGFISFDNWIIIQNDLVNAKKNYLNSQANALFAEANWIQAKGETLEYAKN